MSSNIMSDRWGIIYVPMAGVKQRHKRWLQIKAVLDQRKVQYDYVQSEDYGSVERLARMLVDNGYKTIVIVAAS